MAERFDDLPILDELGDALASAFARVEDGEPARRDPWWTRLRAWLRRGGLPLLVIVGLGLGTTAATGALLGLRATVITAPEDRDESPTMRALVGSGRVSDVSSVDPSGGPAWTVRTTRSATGLTCSTVGQLTRGRFGLVGLDGRFRLLPEQVVDGCGAPVRGRATLLGVRVFDADRQPDVRTVLYGVAGPQVRSVLVRTSAGRRRLRIGVGGTFVLALRGYPEDNAPAVEMGFTGGAIQSRRFGAARGIVPDPDGGPALRAQHYIVGPYRCANVVGARTGPREPRSPSRCVLARADAELLVAQRLSPGQHGGPRDGWNWFGSPARTLAYGWIRRAAPIWLLGAGPPRRVPRNRDGSFVAILPAQVDPRAITIRVGSSRVVRPGVGVVSEATATDRIDR